MCTAGGKSRLRRSRLMQARPASPPQAPAAPACSSGVHPKHHHRECSQCTQLFPMLAGSSDVSEYSCALMAFQLLLHHGYHPPSNWVHAGAGAPTYTGIYAPFNIKSSSLWGASIYPGHRQHTGIGHGRSNALRGTIAVHSRRSPHTDDLFLNGTCSPQVCLVAFQALLIE